MTVKMSVSVPDDVAAFLQSTENASATVADAVRRTMPNARKARQREAALALAEYYRNRTPEEITEEDALTEMSNANALAGTEW